MASIQRLSMGWLLSSATSLQSKQQKILLRKTKQLLLLLVQIWRSSISPLSINAQKS
jgi:hypothetical protein